MKEWRDINPKSWLSSYQSKSILYLTKMLLFYHALGLLLMLAGTSLVAYIDPAREEPIVERNLFNVLSAGPIEETVFFGIPYYALGNPYIVLVTGSVWASLHLLNTGTLDNFSSLALANWLFVIPAVFFSLRTWITGKGWFAIIAHSAWNAVFFAAGCSAGEFECTIFRSADYLVISADVGLPAGLLLLTHMLYKRKKRLSVGQIR